MNAAQDSLGGHDIESDGRARLFGVEGYGAVPQTVLTVILHHARAANGESSLHPCRVALPCFAIYTPGDDVAFV